MGEQEQAGGRMGRGWCSGHGRMKEGHGSGGCGRCWVGICCHEVVSQLVMWLVMRCEMEGAAMCITTSGHIL